MKKKAIDLKKGDKIIMLGKTWEVVNSELSEIGKQGSRKCRLELVSNGEDLVIIRPADYPFETK